MLSRLKVCVCPCAHRPYEVLLHRLRDSSSARPIRTLHTLSKVDRMNPPEMGEHVASCFAGAEIWWHDGGHTVPADPAVVTRFLERAATGR
jgi:hypothetical protein